MATNAIIFSKNRQMQLHLLLESITKYAEGVFDDVFILYKGDYSLIESRFPDCTFLPEQDFRFQLTHLINKMPCEDRVIFYVDDNCLINQMPDIHHMYSNDVISTRLSPDISFCYALQSKHTHTFKSIKHDRLTINWQRSTGDFNYPMSVDGNVYTAGFLKQLVNYNYTNPNSLEDAMQNLKPKIECFSCYMDASVIGFPVNMVNTTHPNKNESKYEVFDLEQLYQDGQVIDMSKIGTKFNSVHSDIDFEFIDYEV
jgi:hypothetical protein